MRKKTAAAKAFPKTVLVTWTDPMNGAAYLETVTLAEAEDGQRVATYALESVATVKVTRELE